MSNLIPKTTFFILIAFALAVNVSQAQEGRTMYANLAKGKNIVGKVVGLEKLRVQTNFGSVEIPISKVAGIRLHADKDDSAVIAFANGDVVTGKIDLKEIQIKTDWGKAYVKANFIESLTADKNSQFYNDQSTGSWRFSRGVNNTQQLGR